METHDDRYGSRRRDLLSRVHEVCRLHWQKQDKPDVQIEELESGGLSYLKVSYTRGPWTKHELVGVHDGQPDEAVLRRFQALVARYGDGQETELVYRDAPASEPIRRLAESRGIWLRGLDEYQRALWDHSRYVNAEILRIGSEPDYPLELHVDKRWAPLGEATPAERTAVPTILDWLDTDGPRFVLVLGDFGTGKTFLSHAIANELAGKDGLVPVLVTMRDLEKGRTLDELLAQHMARRGEDPFHSAAFRYLLREGRIALLFDGFDELALRTSYERVPQHFATLREAAAGAAKVVVTSRHQYFATDSAVRNALGDEVHRLPGSKIIRLFPLEERQRRELVVKTFDGDGDAADEFLDTLGKVPNLLDLGANPRMLTFMIRWYREGILTESALARSAGGAAMTAGALYELLLTTWLKHEVTRQTTVGSLTPMSVGQRMDALRETATRMWRTGRRSVAMDDLGEVADCISDLATLEMRPGEAAQAVGSSTVLVRTADEEFGFIHQSVMEWFVADTARRVFKARGFRGGDEVLSDHELTSPMVDFLCDLAGAEVVIGWARDVVASEENRGPAAKANAALVLQRRNAQALSVNYSAQDLRGRDLTGQDLTNANLTDADLSGAVLPTAMRGVNLSGAKLVGARLVGVDLTNANLSGADLRRARLIGADLTGANLHEACLDRAILIGARITYLPESASAFGAALPGMGLEPHVVGRSMVNAIVALPGGELIITGHQDGTIRITDVAAGEKLRMLSGHVGAVIAVAGGRTGTWIASAGVDATVRIWDTSTGAQLRVLTGHGDGITGMVADPTGGWIAAASRDGQIRIWRPNTGELLAAWDEDLNGAAMAASPNGEWLAVAGVDHVVQIREVPSGRLVHTLKGYREDIAALVVDPLGNWLAAAGRAGTVSWEMATGSQLFSFRDPATALAADPAGESLLVASKDRDIKVLDPSSGRLLRTISEPRQMVTALAVDPLGRWIASANYHGSVQLWDAKSGQPLGENLVELTVLRSLAAGPDGRWLASAGLGRTGGIWDVTVGKLTAPLSATAWQVAAEPTGGRLIANGRRNEIVVLDSRSGEEIAKLAEMGDGIPVLTVDPMGRWLACGDSRSETAWLIDMRPGRAIRTFPGHGYGVSALALDPQGHWLAISGFDGQVRLWSLSKPRWSRQAKLLHSLARAIFAKAMVAAPDGQWLAASGGGGSVTLWDPRSGQQLASFAHSAKWVNALAVDHTGASLASGADDGTVRVWDVESGEARHTIDAHLGEVNALAFDPGGRWLASGGDDGVIRLWNPETGAALGTLICSENGWAVVLPDGRYKVSGNPDRLWWAAGLCRFDAADLAELAPYLPHMRKLDEDEPVDFAG